MRDKEELLGLLLDRIVGEASVPDPDPANWREQIKQLARENRRLLQRHRDAAQISIGRVPVGPHSMPVLERNLAVLLAAGLPPRVVALAADMFALFVGGFAFEESLRQRASRPTRSSSPSTSARCRPRTFPTLHALADDLVAGDRDERFEFAIELLVRGLEAMAKTLSSSPFSASCRLRLLGLRQRRAPSRAAPRGPS